MKFSITLLFSITVYTITTNVLASPLAATIAKLCSQKTAQILSINPDLLSAWDAGNLYGVYEETSTAFQKDGSKSTWTVRSIFSQKNGNEGYCMVIQSNKGVTSTWCRHVTLVDNEIQFSFNITPCPKEWRFVELKNQ